MIRKKDRGRLPVLGATVLCFAVVLGLASCIPPPSNRRTTRRGPTAPGLYSLTGWYGSSWGVDINGEVGHPLTIGGPTANCVPGRNWSAATRIVSGELPPGLTLNDAPWTITGIPTQRGHWILKIELYNVQCNGQGYQGLTQELRIHISGSGKVVE